ncbi:hypothetical protein [Bailinhaonella thermotolerans]|uniref:Secreted protein n=1 Tax=Bailinhaonella thermotolerans TaxID=1070861 RepID=A0A3A4B072_9ACTN|nr:hypothetical protein [Bailinhaonella thermotolerans]RJL31427.1 hypothetical protein D5H75_20565 [Bailinhaonella thermotolerans]
MLRKIAITAAAAAALGGVGLASPALAGPWPGHYSSSHNEWSYKNVVKKDRDIQTNKQIAPIQICNVDLDILAELLAIGNSYDNGSHCVNGSVQIIGGR